MNSKYWTALLCFGFFLAHPASADLQGSWAGWGDWNYEGSGTHCPSVLIRFTEDQGSFTRPYGRLDCDFVSLDMNPLTMKKDGGQFIVDGAVVGSFQGDSYSWTEIYSEKVRIEVAVQRQGLHLDYSENWIEVGDRPLYQIKARLFLHQNL